MPKKEKVYTKLITAPVPEPLLERLVGVVNVTGIKKAQILRNLVEMNVPEVTFTKQFWKDVRAESFIKRGLSKPEVIEELCFSLGLEWAGGNDVIMDGERHTLNVSGDNGITGIISIIESFYKLVYPNEC